jgi:hypothetical protein
MGAKRPLLDRLMEKIAKNEMTGCWEWTAYKEVHGYGVVGFKRKAKLAHRVSYELHRGEIPAGMFVCHRCDNPSCVNPDHLFIGSQVENMADMAAKGRAPKGEAHSCAKLTERDVLAIKEAAGTNETIAAKYGVGPSQVSRIKLGQTWKHLLDMEMLAGGKR